MSGFSRSLKSPYLAPRGRPVLGRTMSGSSERSTASTTDDTMATPSGLTTPQAYQTRRYASQPQLAGSESVSNPREASFSGAGSRPIAIDIPRRLKKINTGPVYTPPEPLSARGDILGGYFPMHEDPTARIRHTHPFHHGSVPRVQPQGDFESTRRRGTVSHPPSTQTMAPHSHVPVTSYCPTGYSDNSLPVGRYYPSNYESSKANHSSRSHGSSTASFSDPKTPDQAETTGSSQPPADLNIRKKLWLQQYQRDMVARHAAKSNDVYEAHGDNSMAKVLGQAPTTSRLLPEKAASFGPQAFFKPNAPRLHPLGSPGPVTPMDLEASDGGYLERGKNREDTGRSSPPPGKGYTANSI